MDKKKRGLALIVNNDKFVHEKFGVRKGSDYDGMNIDQLFTKLHFKTSLKSNLNKEVLSLIEYNF